MASNFVLEGVLEHVVNTNVEFKLKVTDQHSKPCDPDASQKVTAWLKGARENYTAKVEKAELGIVRLTFQPETHGMFDLIIDVGIAHLYVAGDAVVKILAKKKEESIDYDYAITGDALNGGSINKETSLLITVTMNGKPTDVNLATLELTLGHANDTLRFKPVKESTGKYKVTFKVSKYGNYHVDCWQDGSSVLLKPMEALYFRQVADAAHTLVLNVPKNMQAVGKLLTLTIQGKDANDVDLVKGDENFDIGIVGPYQVKDLAVCDLGNGKYQFSFTPPNSGTYEIEVSLNGKGISNSPVKILAGRM